MELRELTGLLDKSDDPEALSEAIQTAIQALMFHQVIYEDTHGVPSASVQAIKEHRLFFEKYLAAAGFDLSIDAKTQMIAITPRDQDRPPYAWRQMRLKKDDTLIRIVLRYLFEQGLINGAMDSTGRVESNTVEITEAYQRIGKTQPPGENRLVDGLLADLQRKGLVRVGEKDRETRVTRLVILPGIRLVVSDMYLDRLQSWLDGEQSKSFLEAAG